MRASLRDENFIAEVRKEWKMMTQKEKQLSTEPSVSGSDETLSAIKDMDDDGFVEEYREKMVKELVQYKSKEALMDTKIYLMSSNIQCVVHNTYPPLEIGFVEYTIRGGIQRIHHKFMDLGDIPSGYAWSAMNHMQSSHKIPLKNFELASKDFVAIGDGILDFLEPSRLPIVGVEKSGHPLIVFSLWDQMDQNEGALKWLANKCCDGMDWNIQVLDVSLLLKAIYSAVAITQPLVVCRHKLSTASFDYSLDTDCHFHDEVQTIHCAQGVAKRIAYALSLSFFGVLRFKLLPTHLPSRELKKYSYFGFIEDGLQNLGLGDGNLETNNEGHETSSDTTSGISSSLR